MPDEPLDAYHAAAVIAKSGSNKTRHEFKNGSKRKSTNSSLLPYIFGQWLRCLVCTEPSFSNRTI